jgi:hypothetical protein
MSSGLLKGLQFTHKATNTKCGYSYSEIFSLLKVVRVKSRKLAYTVSLDEAFDMLSKASFL